MTKFITVIVAVVLLFSFSGKAYCWSLNDIKNTVQQAASGSTNNAPTSTSNNNTTQQQEAQPSVVNQPSQSEQPASVNQADTSNNNASVDMPKVQAGVNDFAGVITQEHKDKLTESIRELEQKTSSEIMVVTVRSTAPLDATEYAKQLWDSWKPEGKDKNNAVLVFLAVKQEFFQIQSGDGLDSILSEKVLGEIHNGVVFKPNNYSDGLFYCVDKIINILHPSQEQAVKNVAQTAPIQADQQVVPSLNGSVNDSASMISSQDKDAINTLAMQLKSKTDSQILVVTVDTTKPDSILDSGHKLFDRMGMGYDAILFLIAGRDQSASIVVGSNLTEVLTNGILSKIINQIVVPQLKQGNPSQGILLGAHAIIDTLVKGNDENARQASSNAVLANIFGWIFLILGISIMGICAYTCFHAYKGRMLFFYNWADVACSFGLAVLSCLAIEYNFYLGWFLIIISLSYNFYMSYKYYYSKKKYLDMIFVTVSRSIMAALLPIAYFCAIGRGARKDQNWYEQMKADAEQAAWLVFLSVLLYRLVNGHLLVELEEETAEYVHPTEPPKPKTPYEILGVNVNDTLEKIKKAYRDLMMKYHPDRCAGLGPDIIAFATVRTQEINAAYDSILKDRGANRG